MAITPFEQGMKLKITFMRKDKKRTKRYTVAAIYANNNQTIVLLTIKSKHVIIKSKDVESIEWER